MTVDDIKKAVARLPPEQLAEFRAWFERFEAVRFDEKIERDAATGKLDRLADHAIDDSKKAALANYEALREPRVLDAYGRLPEQVCALADKNYALLKENPQHPSSQFKKVGRFWSVRVGLRYRALAVEVHNDLVWFWIGSHADYDAMIR